MTGSSISSSARLTAADYQVLIGFIFAQVLLDYPDLQADVSYSQGKQTISTYFGDPNNEQLHLEFVASDVSAVITILEGYLEHPARQRPLHAWRISQPLTELPGTLRINDEDFLDVYEDSSEFQLLHPLLTVLPGFNVNGKDMISHLLRVIQQRLEYLRISL
jgi:hypothetical protein